MRVGRSFNRALGRLSGAEIPAVVELSSIGERVALVSTQPLLSDQVENAAWHRVLAFAPAGRFGFANFTHDAAWRVRAGLCSPAGHWSVTATAFDPALGREPDYWTEFPVGLSLTGDQGAPPPGPFSELAPLPLDLILPAGAELTIECGSIGVSMSVSLWLGVA